MRGITGALREWLQLRARMHGERRFHLENAAADLRALGVSPREAKRQARARFGRRRHLRPGLRELGGDITGLAYLLRAHRVSASAWVQPALLLAVVALFFVLSPARRVLLESVIGTPLSSEGRTAVLVALEGWMPQERAINAADFEALRAIPILSDVHRYQTFVRARVKPGLTLSSIQSEVRARTRNRRLWAGWQFSETRVLTGPAQVIWLFIWCYIVLLLLRQSVSSNRKGRWLSYAIAMAFLHSLVSLVGWALVIQTWKWAADSAGMTFVLLFVAYSLLSAIQCRYWWHDLNQRCLVCLERLVLPLTDGKADRVLLESATTESVCAHGHGVLVESRWSRRFRPEESPLQALVRL